MARLDNDEYRALVESAPTMIRRSGVDGTCDYVNATWLAFSGRALDQELGNGWADAVHPDDLQRHRAAALDAAGQRVPFELEYRLRRSDGLYRHVFERSAPYEVRGAFAGFIASCVDIEDRHTREEASGADEFFEMALDNLCVVQFDGHFVRVSPSWTRTLGWTVEELTARPSEDLVHPEDRTDTLAGRGRLHTGSELGPLVNRYLCKDGTYRWFEWRSVAHPERRLVYASARDVTEQKHAEQALRDAKVVQEKLQRQLLIADRMASVGTLAAGAAHEINNPLMYVTSNINLIIEQLGALETRSPSAEIRELLQMAIAAREGADRIHKVMRGLKTFSRVSEERRSVIDVHTVLDLSVSMTMNEIRQRARLVQDYGKPPLVEADEARLGQVFMNLLINAVQAIPEGDSEAHEIRIVTSTDLENRAVIEIRDTGSGIPAAVLGRVFDPFFTTKPIGIGTGLGLSICHNIVSAMGGEITVTSEEGRGTTVRVALRAAVATVIARPSIPQEVRGKTSAAILVVDDEPQIGVTLRRVLRGHAVTVVTSARQALEVIASGQQFDLILSDLMMPEMSGMELYDELARLHPHLVSRVVFMSGGAFTATANAFLDRVSNPRLEKPFDARSLRELVQRLTREA